MTEPQTILRMRLPQTLKDWLDAAAAQEMQTTSAYVRALLVERRRADARLVRS